MAFMLSSEPLIFFYTIIFTINYTVLPQLILQKLCLRRPGANETVCSQVDNLSDDLHKEASIWWLYLLLCSLVPAVFTVLVWGPVTDIIGRKRAMAIIPFVNGCRSLVYLLNSYFIGAHPAFLLIGSFMSCLYGEFQGVVALCYAYMADVTAHKLDQRTMRMAFIEASLFLSGIPAGLLSGLLLHTVGFVSVFVLTCGINVIILIYVKFYLRDVEPLNKNSHTKVTSYSSEKTTTTTPEHDVESNRDFNWRKLNPFYYLRIAFNVATKSSSRRIVLPLLCAFGFTVCAVLGELIVQTLYLTHEPFIFTSNMIGYYSAVQSAVRGIGVIAFTQLSFRVLKWRDHTMIIVGLLSAVVCYLLIGIARSTTVVFIVNLTGFAIPVATTTLRSCVTKYVSQDEYGSVLASLEALDAIGGVVSNIVSLWMYGVTLSVYTGVVFFALSGFSFIALLIVGTTFYVNRRNFGSQSADFAISNSDWISLNSTS